MHRCFSRPAAPPPRHCTVGNENTKLACAMAIPPSTASWMGTVAILACVRRSHRCTVRSRLEDSSVQLSGASASDVTALKWPWSKTHGCSLHMDTSLQH